MIYKGASDEQVIDYCGVLAVFKSAEEMVVNTYFFVFNTLKCTNLPDGRIRHRTIYLYPLLEPDGMMPDGYRSMESSKVSAFGLSFLHFSTHH